MSNEHVGHWRHGGIIQRDDLFTSKSSVVCDCVLRAVKLRNAAYLCRAPLWSLQYYTKISVQRVFLTKPLYLTDSTRPSWKITGECGWNYNMKELYSVVKYIVSSCQLHSPVNFLECTRKIGQTRISLKYTLDWSLSTLYSTVQRQMWAYIRRHANYIHSHTV